MSLTTLRIIIMVAVAVTWGWVGYLWGADNQDDHITVDRVCRYDDRYTKHLGTVEVKDGDTIALFCDARE